MRISRESLLSKTFHTGITLKGIDGLLEIAGGVLLWFLKPRELSEIARFIFQHELPHDPDDWIAVHVSMLRFLGGVPRFLRRSACIRCVGTRTHIRSG